MFRIPCDQALLEYVPLHVLLHAKRNHETEITTCDPESLFERVDKFENWGYLSCLLSSLISIRNSNGNQVASTKDQPELFVNYSTNVYNADSTTPPPTNFGICGRGCRMVARHSYCHLDVGHSWTACATSPTSPRWPVTHSLREGHPPSPPIS